MYSRLAMHETGQKQQQIRGISALGIRNSPTDMIGKVTNKLIPSPLTCV
jgi:hypothetical protein